MTFKLHRRRFLTGAAIASTSALAGCFDPLLSNDAQVRGVLEKANDLTYRAQRLLLGSDNLAREFAASEIRQPMRPNGLTDPQDEDYRTLAANGFTDYRLKIDGAVERPMSFSLEQLRNMPSRTQITRHDCVEGWSCIAKWTGTPLGGVLDQVGVTSAARYAVFSCFDTLENGFAGPIKYYESIDLHDARHPQTILAYGMNDQALPVSNGAPLRVRVERQLGYKMAKYISAITLTDRLDSFGEGGGGYWEDRGYEWFAGI
ncbi:molybdopterin-binding protein [Aureimonas sp. AU12]|uniref:molybdopterin-binding protein n=1 Tax=Aureimonas sp. AU12 TaxID=1638161 RepID=UPI000781263E|nr:molybdopterin-binding protein [Aureimonas sp. AU12]